MQTILHQAVAMARATMPKCKPYAVGMLEEVIKVIELSQYGTVSIDDYTIDLSRFAGGDHEELLVHAFDDHFMMILDALAPLNGYGKVDCVPYAKGYRTIGVKFRVKATVEVPQGHDHPQAQREQLSLKVAA